MLSGPPSSPRQQFVRPSRLFPTPLPPPPRHAPPPIKSRTSYCLCRALGGGGAAADAIVLFESHSLFLLQSALFIYSVSLSFFLSSSLSPPLTRQRRRRPVAHPGFRGFALSVSPAGVRVRRSGGVHSRRVSHHNGKKTSVNPPPPPPSSSPSPASTLLVTDK